MTSPYRTVDGSPKPVRIEGLTKIWFTYLPACPNCNAAAWYTQLVRQCSKRAQSKNYSICAKEAGFGHSHHLCQECQKEFIVDIRMHETENVG